MTDEIVDWGDGKCYKRWKHGWEEKLEKERDDLKSDNQELKSDKHKLEDNLELEKRKVCEVILRHIKSLKGHFSEYIENANDLGSDQIDIVVFYSWMDAAHVKGVKEGVLKYLQNL